MPTGTQIVTEARVTYLNASTVAFSDTAMLAVLNAEYDSLWQTLREHDVPIVNEVAIITVSALAVSIPPGGGAGQLPTDFAEPIRLEERNVGAQFFDRPFMEEVQFLPDQPQRDKLLVWQWREQEIKLVGATVAKEVKLTYVKTLAALGTLADNVTINFSQSYLAAAVAARAALTIGHNRTLHDDIAGNYRDPKLDKLLTHYAKKQQNLPFRRRGYSRRRAQAIG